MTAQKGKDLLLKVDTDGGGSFTTVAGLRAHPRFQRGGGRRDRPGIDIPHLGDARLGYAVDIPAPMYGQYQLLELIATLRRAVLESPTMPDNGKLRAIVAIEQFQVELAKIAAEGRRVH